MGLFRIQRSTAAFSLFALTIFGTLAPSFGAPSALGGGDPGGGAFMHKDGQLVTLPEAGYILMNSSDSTAPANEVVRYFTFTTETKQAVKTLLKELPFKRDIYNLVMKPEDRSVFVDANSLPPAVEQANFNRVKSDYKTAMTSAGYPFDEKNFGVAAYSSNGQTYIRSAFNDLTSRRQALILIHEYFVRNFKSVSFAWMMDSIIHTYLTSDRSDRAVWIFHQALKSRGEDELKWFLFDGDKMKEIENRLFARTLGQVEAKLGRALLTSELFLKPQMVVHPTHAEIDPSLAKSFEAISPRLAEKLTGAKVFVYWTLGLFGDVTPEKFYEKYDEKFVGLMEHLGNNYLLALPKAQLPTKEALASHVYAMGLQLCTVNADALAKSEFGTDDTLIHYDQATENIWLISCKAQENEPSQPRFRIRPMNLKEASSSLVQEFKQ